MSDKRLQSSSEKDLQNARYRFRGYVLPKVQLDETGSTYYVVAPHPYLYNQLQYWQSAAISGHPGGYENASHASPVPGGAGSLYPFLPNNENT